MNVRLYGVTGAATLHSLQNEEADRSLVKSLVRDCEIPLDLLADGVLIRRMRMSDPAIASPGAKKIWTGYRIEWIDLAHTSIGVVPLMCDVHYKMLPAFGRLIYRYQSREWEESLVGSILVSDRDLLLIRRGYMALGEVLKEGSKTREPDLSRDELWNFMVKAIRAEWRRQGRKPSMQSVAWYLTRNSHPCSEAGLRKQLQRAKPPIPIADLYREGRPRL